MSINHRVTTLFFLNGHLRYPNNLDQSPYPLVRGVRGSNPGFHYDSYTLWKITCTFYRTDDE
jgi:hypothetical protein